jgi:hypothetical protein
LISSLKKYGSQIARMGSIKADSTPNTIVFVFGAKTAEQFTISVKNTVTRKPLNNVVGMLAGKTKPDEYVIFSAITIISVLASPTRIMTQYTMAPMMMLRVQLRF